MQRSQARETAFIYYFEKLFNPEISWDELTELAAESEVLQGDAFTRTLFEAAVVSVEEADGEIRRYLKNWRLERLPKTVLAILRLSVAELLSTKDVPPGVVANEAVELAKKYATPKDASFINGVLGSFIRARQKPAEPAASAGAEAPAETAAPAGPAADEGAGQA